MLALEAHRLKAVGSSQKFRPLRYNRLGVIIEIEDRSDHVVELIQGAWIDLEDMRF